MRYHHRLVAVLQVSCIDLVGNFPEKLLSSEVRINITADNALHVSVY